MMLERGAACMAVFVDFKSTVTVFNHLRALPSSHLRAALSSAVRIEQCRSGLWLRLRVRVRRRPGIEKQRAAGESGARLPLLRVLKCSPRFSFARC